ncbi:MAG: UbiA family prenyltransferase, partial [Krumholzibacteria bacterium]|nr:UbiA family prenyltransferase [Candidatus Krumholzibacteria bacterium]
PRQWPILTAQLLVGVLLAQPDRAQLAALGAPAALGTVALAWVAWVVLLNGGTLAYNSAWDRDTGPVAFLARPPRPPAWLAEAALGTMAAGAVLGAATVGTRFGHVTAACVALSVMYSHPAPRLKARPGLDLAVNMAGYGAGTTLAGLLAGRAATGQAPGADDPWLVGGFALLFGSLYPLTQIYQAADDAARGDRTLTTALGVRPVLALALVLGLLAAGALLRTAPAGTASALVGGACVLWLAHLAQWLARAGGMDAAGHERGMYVALALWAGVDAALVAARFL